MSQIDPTDLLCRSRREELSVDERRRLNESIERSLEVKLMSQILPELERESRVRPGDDLLLARINARALGALGASGASERAPRRRRAFTMLLVAAAVLLVAGLAGAWFSGVRPWRARESSSEIAKPKAKVKGTPSGKPMQIAKPLASSLIEPIEPIEPITPAPAPIGAIPGRTGRDSKEAAPGSASELFARANLLRRQGRGGEAAVLYELLLDLYPTSREVGPTRLALAKYLQAKQPERALAQYRAVAGSGGALRAEALWGISEVASGVGQRSVAEQALADLLREFPDSPYAEVARTRTSHGSP